MPEAAEKGQGNWKNVSTSGEPPGGKSGSRSDINGTSRRGLLLQPLVDCLSGDAELAGDGGLVASVAGERVLEPLAARRQGERGRSGGRELLVHGAVGSEHLLEPGARE